MLATVASNIIEVTVTGNEKRVNDSIKDIKPYIDLNNAVEGTTTETIKWDLPLGIDLIDYTPKQIEITITK